MTEYNNHREIINLGDLVSKLFKEKAELENRIEALENQIVKPNEMIDYSEVALDLVKQRVTELLKSTKLPDWATWATVDEDGATCYHELEPNKMFNEWIITGEGYKAGYVVKKLANWNKCIWRIDDLLNEQPLVKKSDENLNSDDVKLSKSEENLTNVQNLHIAQVDWKNLLSVYDVKKLCVYEAYSSHTRELNKLIYQHIKPLLEAQWYLRETQIDITQLNQLNDELRKQVAELKAENKKLDEAGSEAQMSSNDFESELMGAKEQISALEQSYKNCMDTRIDCNRSLEEVQDRLIELEAENAREFGIGFNKGRLHRKANQINVPFRLDDDGDVLLYNNNRTMYGYCKDYNIDQSDIKSFTITMKSEEE